MLFKNKLITTAMISVLFVTSCSNEMEVETSSENSDGGGSALSLIHI